MEQFHRFKKWHQHSSTAANKTENWDFVCRCLTDLCRSPCRSEKDALQQLHKTLGYISWALDQKKKQTSNLYAYTFTALSSRVKNFFPSKLNLPTSWAAVLADPSLRVFLKVAARLQLSVSWGGQRGKGRKEGPQPHWKLGITFQTAHWRTMRKVDAVLNSTALLDGDVIHPSIYGHRCPALVWTPKWGRRKGSNLLHCFAFPLGKEARLDSRWHDSRNVSTFKFRFLFPHLYFGSSFNPLLPTMQPCSISTETRQQCKAGVFVWERTMPELHSLSHYNPLVSCKAKGHGYNNIFLHSG